MFSSSPYFKLLFMVMTSLLRQNNVATSFWRNDDVIITPCVRWVGVPSTWMAVWNSFCWAFTFSSVFFPAVSCLPVQLMWPPPICVQDAGYAQQSLWDIGIYQGPSVDVWIRGVYSLYHTGQNSVSLVLAISMWIGLAQNKVCYRRPARC